MAIRNVYSVVAQNSTVQCKVSKELAGSGEKTMSSGSSGTLIGIILCEKTQATVMFAENSIFIFIVALCIL